MLVVELSNNKENDNNEQETLRDAVRQFCVEIEWHVLLQADQRPKQNHEDVLLPAHPQELYPSGKESGLMLNQKIIRQSITQYQNN